MSCVYCEKVWNKMGRDKLSFQIRCIMSASWSRTWRNDPGAVLIFWLTYRFVSPFFLHIHFQRKRGGKSFIPRYILNTKRSGVGGRGGVGKKEQKDEFKVERRKKELLSNDRHISTSYLPLHFIWSTALTALNFPACLISHLRHSSRQTSPQLENIFLGRSMHQLL